LNLEGRILALDYGKKRIGIAVTDPLQLSVNGLDTRSEPELLEFLSSYLLTEQVAKVVLGEPKDLQGAVTSTTQAVYDFKERLLKKFPQLDVVLFDERFTSILAARNLKATGLSKKKRRDKKLIDQSSAMLLLKDYLEAHTL